MDTLQLYRNIKLLQVKYYRAVERVNFWDEELRQVRATLDDTSNPADEEDFLKHRLSLVENIRNTYYECVKTTQDDIQRVKGHLSQMEL